MGANAVFRLGDGIFFDYFCKQYLKKKLIFFVYDIVFYFFLADNSSMFELLIDKVIGEAWFEESVSSDDVRKFLAAFPSGETEMRITIDSPGGDVFEGITIFNIIRDFARNNPDVEITTYVQGMAASMASVIALAAWSVNPRNDVIVEDNSIFMIHNAWGIVMGDENDMREGAEWFSKVDDMLRAVYVRRSGKSDDEIKAMMDAETWLWGDEIVEAGFAAAIMDMPKNDDGIEGVALTKNERLVSAKAAFTKSQELMRSVSAKRKENGGGKSFKAAAMALGFEGGSPSKNGAVDSADNKKGDGSMKITVDELKKDNPEIYAQIAQDGEKAGVAKEQGRVSRLLALGEKSGAKDFALECIKNGSDPSDEKVIDAFMDKGAAARHMAACAEDERNIPDVNPPKEDKNANAKAMNDAFAAALKGGSDYGDD